MATRTRSGGGLAGAIYQASRRYRVPLWVLAGVKLIETGQGSGIGAVSPTGAQGPFQFEPATARSMGIRDPNNTAEAANGAAKLLASYRRHYGSWNAALEAYNAGPGNVGRGVGYTEADVRARLAEAAGPRAKTVGFRGFFENFPTNPFNSGEGMHALEELFSPEGPPGASGRLGEPNPGAGELKAGGLNPLGGLEAVGSFFGLLLTTQFWIRVLEVLAGAVLLYMGIKDLTGVDPAGKATKLSVPPLRAGLGPAAV